MRTRCLRRLLTAVLVSVALLAAASPAWAFKGLAKIVGSAQGVIHGDNTSKDAPGSVVIRGMSFALDQPIDLASGLPTGKLRLAPFRLVKEPDRATPKLLTAAATGELLTVEIKWFRTLSTGVVQHYFTVTLLNARVSSMDAAGDVTVAGGVLETLGLVYDRITMKDEINNVVSQVDRDQ